MAIFNSCVKLPEANCLEKSHHIHYFMSACHQKGADQNLWIDHIFLRIIRRTPCGSESRSHGFSNQIPPMFQILINYIKLTIRSLGLITSKSLIPPCWSSKSPLVQQSVIQCRGALRTRRGPRVRVRAAARARRSGAPPRRRAPGAGPRRWARSGVEAIGKNIGKA